MKTSLLLLFALLFFVNPTAAQDEANASLAEVYTDMVSVFKSENDSILKDFCQRLMADEPTMKYMREHHLCYRGVPCKLDEEGLDPSALGEDIYPSLLRVRNSMMHAGLLGKLKHIDSTNYKWDVVIIVSKFYVGTTIPQSQNDFSLSQEKYAEALIKLDSLGQTFEEQFLAGSPGKVHVINGTEMPMLLKSGKKRIQYSLGEMVYINNKWSLFTRPSVDYSVGEK